MHYPVNEERYGCTFKRLNPMKSWASSFWPIPDSMYFDDTDRMLEDDGD